jgi:hypothetical protein
VTVGAGLRSAVEEDVLAGVGVDGAMGADADVAASLHERTPSTRPTTRIVLTATGLRDPLSLRRAMPGSVELPAMWGARFAEELRNRGSERLLCD